MKPTRLPAPEMPLLTSHDEYSMAHLIERHINFVTTDKDGNEYSVALDPVFVRHYMKYRESTLPVVTAIVTAPMVLADGTLLATQGLDRKRGILFRLQPEFLAILPKSEECTGSAVAEAMRFLTDEWLCDVSSDYAGKCILITAALTILERALLPERPAFFVTAGQRGGGKTTTLQMLFLAATGYRAPAAAWSSSEEERRKCLFSYLGEGVPAVVWDNIPRGSTISCPSIEKSLTAAVYSDRVLGETGTRTVPSTTVNMFTGNNISPRGDMASRSLVARLSVDRPDPENRKFVHEDPIAWTTAHRGNVLHALYTIMLGNPRLRDRDSPAAQTRFKAWWHLVGSAVENAAARHIEHVDALAIDRNAISPPAIVSFRKLFLDGEQHEEQTSSLATVLDTLRMKWPAGFKASDLASYLGAADSEAIEVKGALEQASGKLLPILTPTAVTWRLKALADAPVLIGDKVWALRYVPDTSKMGGSFVVRATGG
jgi:hypothetical protein